MKGRKTHKNPRRGGRGLEISGSACWCVYYQIVMFLGRARQIPVISGQIPIQNKAFNILINLKRTELAFTQ